MIASDTMHATCVAWQGRAALIVGASGSGKSSLGLSLMALGCTLVADDGVRLSAHDGELTAHCPDTIAGLIEARRVGILNASYDMQARVVLVVDLDRPEAERLPPQRLFTALGCDVPLIYRVDAPHFAAAILQILKAGWSDR